MGEAVATGGVTPLPVGDPHRGAELEPGQRDPAQLASCYETSLDVAVGLGGARRSPSPGGERGPTAGLLPGTVADTAVAAVRGSAAAEQFDVFRFVLRRPVYDEFVRALRAS